jgi:DNA-binding transcriptional MerR regulator
MSHLSPILQEALAQQKYFKIGEAAALLELKPHVLRYWESEFSQIRSQKTKNDQRVYHRKDVVIFQQIKHLLYDKKMTIAGVRNVLRENPHGELFQDDVVEPGLIEEIALESSQISPMPKEPEVQAEVGTCAPYESEATFPEEEMEQLFSELPKLFDDQGFMNQHLGEVISDGIAQAKHKQDEIFPKSVRRDDFNKAITTLQDSKRQLEELLASLDAFLPQ